MTHKFCISSPNQPLCCHFPFLTYFRVDFYHRWQHLYKNAFRNDSCLLTNDIDRVNQKLSNLLHSGETAVSGKRLDLDLSLFLFVLTVEY